MMKTLLTIFALCFSVVVNVFGATPSFLSFDTNDFTVLPSLATPQRITANRGSVTNIFNNTTIIENHVTNIFTGDVTVTTNSITTNYFNITVFQGGTNIFNDGTNIFNNSYTFITNGTTVITITTNITINGTNVATVGDLVFTNSAGFIYSLGPHTTMSVTNLTSDRTLTARGGFITPNLLPQPLSNGVNVVNTFGSSMIFLYAFETNATVKLDTGDGSGSHVWIFNVFTNIAWTLPSGPLADDTNNVIVVRGGAWTPSEIGESIELVGTPGGYAEIGRSNPNGPAPSVGGVNYWTNATVSSVSSLFPLDPTLQPLVASGWYVGTNSPSLYGSSALTGEALVAMSDVSAGDPVFREVFLNSSLTSNSTVASGAADLTAYTNRASLSLGVTSNGVPTGITLDANAGGGSVDFNMRVEGQTKVDLLPTASDGTTPFAFGTSIAHTTGNLLEVANDGTNMVQAQFDGGLYVGPNSKAAYGESAGIALVSIRNRDLGDGADNTVYLKSVYQTTNIGTLFANADSGSPVLTIKADNGAGAMRIDASATPVNGYISIHSDPGNTWFIAEPSGNGLILNRNTLVNTIGTNSIVQLGYNGTNAFALDVSTAAHDTRMLLFDVDANTIKRVSVGANDSGGSGFKLLRVSN